MKVIAIGNSLVINKYIKSTLNSNNHGKDNNQVHLNEHNNFDISTSHNQKNEIVSEKLDKNTHSPGYYLRYQSNVQITKSETSTKTYNEVKKSRLKEKEEESSEFYTIVEDWDREYTENSLISFGSYYVVPGKDEELRYKVLRSYSNMWKDKLEKAYNVGFKKEPGSLVNLVF